MIPTTDQMDSTTPEERRKLVAMCEGCGNWQFYTRKDTLGGSMMKSHEGISCENCGGVGFRGTISQRTFDIERAKKETAKYLKGKK